MMMVWALWLLAAAHVFSRAFSRIPFSFPATRLSLLCQPVVMICFLLLIILQPMFSTGLSVAVEQRDRNADRLLLMTMPDLYLLPGSIQAPVLSEPKACLIFQEAATIMHSCCNTMKQMEIV